MTAAGLSCRLLGGQPPKDPLVRKQASLLLRTLPVWDPDGFGCDLTYWSAGTAAMHLLGEPPWKRWGAAIEQAAPGSQRRDGEERGSWVDTRFAPPAERR